MSGTGRTVARVVMITGAFLAESAEAVDNKLNVTGGVIEKWTVDSTRDVRLVLVLLTQTQTGEPPNDLEIKLRPPASAHRDPLIIRGRIPKETARGEVGFAISASEPGYLSMAGG
jgi:hypothetical protein